MKDVLIVIMKAKTNNYDQEESDWSLFEQQNQIVKFNLESIRMRCAQTIKNWAILDQAFGSFWTRCRV